MRLLLRFILKNSLMLLSLMLLVMSFWLVTTERGLRLILWSLHHCVFMDIKIKEAHGNLYSAFSLKNISYKTQSTTFLIDNFAFEWNPMSLLLNKITIKNLKISKAHVFLKNNDDAPISFSFLKHIAIQHFTIDDLQITKGHSILTFTGTYDKEWRGDWQIHIPHLNEITPILSGEIKTDGKLTGSLFSPVMTAQLHANHLKIEGTTIQQIEGNAILNLKHNTPSKLIFSAKSINTPLLNVDHIQLTSTIILDSTQTLISQINATINQHYYFSGEIKLPQLTKFNLSQSIIGKISAHTDHLEWITHLYQEIKEPRGKLTGALLINGTLKDPVFQTQLNLNEGGCKVPSIGITPQHIQLSALQKNGWDFVIQGKLQSGTGRGELSGHIDISAPTPVNLQLNGVDLDCVHLPDYKIIASPKVNLSYANHILSITGDIPIPIAEINPRKWSNTVSLPDEVIFMEDHSHKATFPLETAIHINLQLGNKIHVVYHDLQTYLKGNITIHWGPKTSATALGELYAVNGHYNAYGQTLSILEGRLVYTGNPLSNPGLNIRAGKLVKTVILNGQSSFTQNWTKPIYAGTENLTVGIQISGTFDKRNISLFSNPSGLNQNDILSYLTFGYPQSQISDQQHKILLKAASAFNFGGKTKFSNLTDTIQNKLGLSEMNLESIETFNPKQGKIDSTTSLVVSKQIFSNLYAHYSVGLSNPISTLNLRYQLSKRFAIQSETSQLGNGADLLYSIERD